MSVPLTKVDRLVPGLIEPPGGKVRLEPMPGDLALPSANPAQAAEPQSSFTEVFTNMLNGANELSVESAQLQTAFMNGEPVELHDIMIKAEEAGITLDLVLEIRNKLVNAYNEVMHMPI